MLGQKDDNNEEHPVASQKHSTIEKECLAIKLGICAFRVYLMGCPFIIETGLVVCVVPLCAINPRDLICFVIIINKQQNYYMHFNYIDALAPIRVT